MGEPRPWPAKHGGLMVAALIAVLGVAGCRQGSGEAIAPALDEPTYERLLVEVMVTHQMYDTMADSAKVDSARRSLMRRNGTTWEAFLESHAQYELDLDTQIERISRLQALVQREMQKITAYQRGDPGAMEEVLRLLEAERAEAALQGAAQERLPDAPGSPGSQEPSSEPTESEANEKAPVEVS